ncbi:hypothetical protein PHMEG_00016794 [Phytophthora megakarya]|uniref:Uncharacterized protein n=1 Tax=Phytophthora megakarya TaxID=4795 RepID=A0A225VYC9_9STRA|nr:hypothetical protein PHMEG_00016794 [Phytophthora megakarya]
MVNTTPGSRLTLQIALNTLKSQTEMDEIIRDGEDESFNIMHVAKKQNSDDITEKLTDGAKP